MAYGKFLTDMDWSMAPRNDYVTRSDLNLGEIGGGGMSSQNKAEMFTALGDLLHKNINATTGMFLQNNLANKQINLAKDKWAIEKKMLMRQLIENRRKQDWRNQVLNGLMKG